MKTTKRTPITEQAQAIQNAKTKGWVVMSIPGDERTPTNWYAFNRNTLAQVRCDNLEEASRIVAELRN